MNGTKPPQSSRAIVGAGHSLSTSVQTVLQNSPRSSTARLPKGRASGNSRTLSSPQSQKIQAVRGTLALPVSSTAPGAPSIALMTNASKIKQPHTQLQNQQQSAQQQAFLQQHAALNARASGSRPAPTVNPIGSTAHSTGSVPKRARSSSFTGKEPESKRAKPASAVVPRTPYALQSDGKQGGAGTQLVPQSPTSSRSRTRKPRKAGRSDSELGASVSGSFQGTNITALAPNGVSSNPSRARTQNAKTRPNQSRPFASQQNSNGLTMDGLQLPANVKIRTLRYRLFGPEIQGLMHAFGEVRYCARDTLELVEDSVRNAVRHVAIEAATFASESESFATPKKGSSLISVQVEHVAHAIRKESRILARLVQSLRAFANGTGDVNDAKSIKELEKVMDVRAASPLDLIADIVNVPHEVFSPPEKPGPTSDPANLCTYRVWHMCRSSMTPIAFKDFATCRSISFVQKQSSSRAPTVQGQPRISLFRDWLGLSEKDNVKVPEATLYALGHIAYEAVGKLTQTALLCKHFDGVAKGLEDPRAFSWTNERHILAALGSGIGTGIMIPLTDEQLHRLRVEIDLASMTHASLVEKLKGRASTGCLTPVHIREALRRIGSRTIVS